MLFRRLSWLLNLNVERVCQHMAVNRNAGVHAIIVFIQYDCQKFSKTKHSRLVLNLFEPFDSELIEQMNEELLALLVPHDFSEPPEFVLSQVGASLPSLENELVDFLLEAFVKLCL